MLFVLPTRNTSMPIAELPKQEAIGSIQIAPFKRPVSENDIYLFFSDHY